MPTEKETYIKLGKCLKEQRIKRNLSQEDVAMFMNTTRNCIANYENGRRFMGVDTLWKFELLFNCDFKKLINKIK